MMMRLLLLLTLACAATSAQARTDGDTLLILSYHDIRDDVAEQGDPDGFAIHSQNFASHLDWLSGNGYHPISLAQLIAAVEAGVPLPPKPVLLTFDDGLRSLWTHAFPLLRAYGYPALAAVVTSWVDLPAGEQVDYGHRMFDRDDFVTWDQLREMQDSGLLEVASHSHDLHHGIQANPQGSQTPAAITRRYAPGRGYESEADYRLRIESDLRRSRDLIEARLGRPPRSIVWPYAAYNRVANEIAEALGMRVSFDLQGPSSAIGPGLHGLARQLIMNNPGVHDLVNELRRDRDVTGLRVLRVELDLLYDDDPEQIEHRLDLLVERVQRIGPTHVFLQAFADPEDKGSASALYFPNRHLPMRADLFSRVAWQLLTRAGTEVYAWMPVLGFEPADPEQRRRLAGAGSEHAYRLDLEQAQARRMVLEIYEDLAASSYLAGLLFHDTTTASGQGWTVQHEHDLIAFTQELKHAAETWRPKLATSRGFPLRSAAVENPALTPSLEAFHRAYDYTVLITPSDADGELHKLGHLDALVTRARMSDDGLTGTLFELSTRSPSGRPVAPAQLAARLRHLQTRGVRHLAWHPDDFRTDQPPWSAARAALSARSFPYELR